MVTFSPMNSQGELMELNFVSWGEAQSSLRYIRQKVFVEEQQVPESLEWDSKDRVAIHILGKEGNRPIACARLLRDGQLGRLAVLKNYRKNGWGMRILRAAEQRLMSQKKTSIYLNSQANSYQFYFRNGFRPNDKMFWDANIPHIQMHKILSRPNPTNKIFILGEDDENHTSEQAAASPVWFQIGSNQSRREINIRIDDLCHPVFNNPFCVDNLREFIRQSQKTQIRVIIHKETPGLSEHPLLLLQQRMSSRFKIRCINTPINKEHCSNQILFDLKGYMRFDYQASYCNFNNPLSVSRHRLHFEQEWSRSKQLVEGRKFNA
jgi:predicted GNAT family N-acyltransferase